MCKKILLVFAIFLLSVGINAKDVKRSAHAEERYPNRVNQGEGSALFFADEFKLVMQRYMFGMCPQPSSYRWSQISSKKNATTFSCDPNDDKDLAGRLSTLAFRLNTISSTDCSRFGVALANTFTELAQIAAERQVIAAAAYERKRRLSKSQKAKIASKQRAAIAVRKKAAATAAAAAAAAANAMNAANSRMAQYYN